jgi:hypothetical protein
MVFFMASNLCVILSLSLSLSTSLSYLRGRIRRESFVEIDGDQYLRKRYRMVKEKGLFFLFFSFLFLWLSNSGNQSLKENFAQMIFYFLFSIDSLF